MLSNKNIRLKQFEIEAIKSAFSNIFSPDDHLWLFGSRADPEKKGGDIDLYIETKLSSTIATESRLKLIAAICDAIGDQKVDVVVNLLDDNLDLPIYTVAKEEGVKII